MAKPFAWSFSRLKNFETCPLKYHEVDVLKTFREDESEQLKWGDFVHKTMAKVLLGGSTLPLPVLPPEMALYQKWIDKVRKLPGKLFVEQKYAIDKDFKPTEYFAPNVWYRGIGDVVKIAGTRGAILDWKTGKIKPDSVQLMLMAQCLFSFFPQLQLVHTAFIWLQEDTTTPEEFTREDLAEGWVGLFDRVAALEGATKTNIWPPKPSGLCHKYCPVTTCQHNGKFNKGATNVAATA